MIDPVAMLERTAMHDASSKSQAESPPAPDARLRKLRHDMLNVIGVVQLEMHMLKRHAGDQGAQVAQSIQEQVDMLQPMLDELCDEAREMARRASTGD
ncbi:MAG: hypothetical protein RIE32_12925 [Phycisphaerales bacterium]